jgi:hypothetical protein
VRGSLPKGIGPDLIFFRNQAVFTLANRAGILETGMKEALPPQVVEAFDAR